MYLTQTIVSLKTSKVTSTNNIINSKLWQYKLQFVEKYSYISRAALVSVLLQNTYNACNWTSRYPKIVI